MNYSLFENFITEKECKILYDWIIEHKNTNLFTVPGHPGTIRKTTRFSKKITYPDIAYDIQKNIDNKIKDFFELDHLEHVSAFPDGMYASIGQTNDSCKIHKDPRYIVNHITYHFNIILSEYENADLYIEDKLVKLNKRDGILYPVSEVDHYTTKLTGTNPRLFWCFGYCIPLQKTIFAV
jgi:hypothetical protein